MRGDFQQSELQGAGISECPCLVAEQLALEQGLGNRRAIDRDEGIGGTAAGCVDPPGKQLLAGSRFADEQNCDRSAGSDLRSEGYRVAKSGAFTDDMSVPTLFRGC
jgi:hypothetical protein